VQIIKNELIVYVDCDKTLVMWNKPKKKDKVVAITDPYDGTQRHLVVHQGHVKVLKDRKARGSTICVWSAAGYRWAEKVVRALGLEAYVDYVQSKPIAFVDDLQAHEILGERIYLGEDSDYGKD
jgi:predicted phosphatase